MTHQFIMKILKYKGQFILRQKLSCFISNKNRNKQERIMKLKKRQYLNFISRLMNKCVKILLNSKLRLRSIYKQLNNSLLLRQKLRLLKKSLIKWSQQSRFRKSMRSQSSLSLLPIRI